MEPEAHERPSRGRAQGGTNVDPGGDPATRRRPDEEVQNSDDLRSRRKVMSEGSAWSGDWRVRLRERIRDRGYDSVTAFAEERPTVSFADLADELGQDIAG